MADVLQALSNALLDRVDVFNVDPGQSFYMSTPH